MAATSARTAPAPARITPKGKLSDEFIIEVLARKYQQHLPIYRIRIANPG